MVFKDIIPESDLKAYSKGNFGIRSGYGKRPAVIVIDMTYGFVDPSYPLSSGEMALGALEAIKHLLEETRKKGTLVIYTIGLSGSSDTPAERGISRKSNLIKRITKPRENDIIDEIAPQQGDTIINKRKASAFFGTNLLSILVYHNIDTLIITGATTSGCVRASVLDAASYNYFVVIPEECVADRAIVPHKVNLFDIDMKYGDVTPLLDVVEYLRKL